MKYLKLLFSLLIFSFVSVAEERVQSSFLQDDVMIEDVLSGDTHRFREDRYKTDQGINTLSFEYKMVSVFRQLGYNRIYFYPQYNSTKYILSSLELFQEKYNLEVDGSRITETDISTIDQVLFSSELYKEDILSNYEPADLFISTTNEPNSKHLAFLFASFFKNIINSPANPHMDNMDYWKSLAYGMSRNIGYIADSEGKYILNPGECQRLLSEEQNIDFKIYSKIYYQKLQQTFGDSISEKVFVSPGPRGDYTFMTTFIHEYGHLVGRQYHKDDIRFDKALGETVFDMKALVNPEDPGSGSSTFLYADDNGFISEYSKFNNKEFFAENYTAYVLQGRIFRWMKEEDQLLAKIYYWLKDNVFSGIEYQTGDMESLYKYTEGLQSLSGGYEFHNPDFVWDYSYNKLEAEVSGHAGNLSSRFQLYQNYPNPFNSSTEISFSLLKPNYIEFNIFNILGERVMNLEKEYDAGEHQIRFNTIGLSSGTYFYCLKFGDQIQKKKMVIMK